MKSLIESLQESLNEGQLEDLYTLGQLRYVELKKDSQIATLDELEDLKDSYDWEWADEKYIKKHSDYFKISGDYVYIKKGSRWESEGDDGSGTVRLHAVGDESIWCTIDTDWVGDFLRDCKKVK